MFDSDRKLRSHECASPRALLPFCEVWVWIVVLVALTCGPRAPQARAEEETRFYALEHFPSDVLLYASIDNAARLKAGWQKTLTGRIASHPGWVRALRGLWERIAQEPDFKEIEQAFVDVTGKTPLDLLALPRGEITLGVRFLAGAPMPEVALAIELGETGSEIVSVVSKLKEFVARETGQPPETRDVAGVPATVWPGPAGSLYETRLADHLVVVSTPGLLREISEAYRGARPQKRLRDSKFHRTLQEQLGIPEPELRVGVDLSAIYRLVQTFIENESDAEEARQVIEFLGADRLTTLGTALGFRDEGVEYAVHVGAHEPRGLLETLLGALRPLDLSTEALGKIPQSAYQAGAFHVAPGKLARGLVGLVRKYFPDAEDDLQEIFGKIAEETGIQVERDLYGLAPVQLQGFVVEPPAGGLFPDNLVILRTEAFASYLAVLNKLAAAAQAETRSLPSADSAAGDEAPRVQYLSIASGKAGGGALWELIAERGRGEPSVATVLGLLLPTIAWVDLPGGWTVASTVPQAVVRYLSYYGREAPLGGTALGQLLAAEAKGASAVSVFHSGKTLLWLYNSLLSVANSVGSLLHGVGIDLGSVPPAEVFLDSIHPGFAGFAATPSGVTLRGHRAHATTAVVAFFGGAAFVWAVGIPFIGF